MKKFFRLSAMLIAAPLLLTGCPSPEPVIGDVKFVVDGEDVQNTSLNFNSDASTQDITLKVAGKWTATSSEEWVAVSPKQGNESSLVEKQIIIGVEANSGDMSRPATVTFRSGTRKATLTITQNGHGVGDALYSEKLGPAVVANTNADVHEGYERGGTLDQSGVTYSATQTGALRNSLPATGVGFSGPALVFLGSGQSFQIANINVTGNEALTLKFSAGILEGVYPDQVCVAPSASNIKVEAGYDGVAWDEVEITGQAGTGTGTGNWGWATAPFKVQAGTTSIYIRIKMLGTDGGRIDDFTLSAGGNGPLINPDGPLPSTALYDETFGAAVVANTAAPDHTGYTRGGTLSQTAVTYASTHASPIRNSMPASGEGFSGPALVFLGNGNNFEARNINVTGNDNITFKLSVGILEGVYPNQTVALPSDANLKIEAGYDGTNWAVVPFNAQAGTGTGTGNWAWVTAPFKVQAGTTAIYLRVTVINADGGRIDDFSIVEGGDGALIIPGGGGEPVKKTIAEVRAAGSIDPTWYVEGTVVSDRTGTNLQAYQIALQDATTPKSGIMINYAQGETNPTYAVGTTVRVNLRNATAAPYNGLMQWAGIRAADVTTVSNITAITAPTTISVAQLKTGDYESMLIAINDCRLDIAPGATMNGNTGNTNVISGSDMFIMRLASSAAFKDELAPTGTGTMIGIANVYNTDYQVSPRTMADVAGMTGEVGDYFTINSASTRTVGYAAGSFDVNVSANVAWTASIAGTGFSINNNGQTGNGTIRVSYTENESTTENRSAVLTVATSADVTTKSYSVVITQSPKTESGDAVAFAAGWDMTGIPEWGASPMNATLNNSNGNITIGGLTKTEFTSSGSPGANNWGGNDFSGNTAWQSAAKYASFTVTSAKTFSVNDLILRLRFTATGPATTALAYQINDGTLTLIEEHAFADAKPSGTSNYGPYTYTMPAALQNLAAGTVVTFRLIPVASSWSTTGNWYISNNGFTGEPLKINGTFVQ